MKESALRDKLEKSTTCLGIFNTSSAPCTTEWCAGNGLRYVAKKRN